MDYTVHGVAKSQTQLSDSHFYFELYCEYFYFTMIDQASVVKVVEMSGQETDPHRKKMQCLCLFLVRLEFMNPSTGRDLLKASRCADRDGRGCYYTKQFRTDHCCDYLFDFGGSFC